MYKEQCSIATIELNEHAYWEVFFKPNVILSLEDVSRIYQYIDRRTDGAPILLDLNQIQGIEFEALEFIARTQNREHPFVIVSEPGSIGERYVHLVNQLCEQKFVCTMFNTIEEARKGIFHLEQKEA